MLDMLSTLTIDELNQIIAGAQALLDMKKTEQRRDEIMAELTDLFAELDELGVEYYFGAPARNGGTDCYIITGDVVLDDDAVIIS
jgi:hypothetical protein